MLQGLLGYLNFSTGKPDPRIQATFFNAWQSVGADPSPWLALHHQLDQGIGRVAQRRLRPRLPDVRQASAVLDLAFRRLPGSVSPAPRRFAGSSLGYRPFSARLFN